MRGRSTTGKLAAGVAGSALLAAMTGFSALRLRSRDPRLAAEVAAGGVLGVVLCAVSAVQLGRELAARGRSEAGLRRLATVDELTGLLNRRGFVEHANGALDLARRLDRPAVVFLADVDGLKGINDRFGHAAGDLTLAGAARILQLTFRSSDVIARIGGDEFAVLALVDAREGGEGILGRLGRSVDFWNGRWGQPFRVSLSIGAVTIDPSEDRLEEILARADRDLYEKKGFRPLVTA